MSEFLLSLSSATASGETSGSSVQFLILMAVLFVVMYFMMIRPQKKRQKEEQEMRASLEIGDEIITIGGIVGRVVTIREEDIVIETGADRTKMKIQRWAINTNVTKMNQHKKEVEAAKTAAKEKRNKKSSKEDKLTTKEEPKVLSDDDKDAE